MEVSVLSAVRENNRSLKDNKKTNLKEVEDLLVILDKKLNVIGFNLATGNVMDSKRITKTIPLCRMFLLQTLQH